MKKYGFWIALITFGLLLRLVFASTLFHTDLKGIYKEARLLEKGVTEAYQAGIIYNTPLHYPPSIYLIYFYYQKFNPLFSGYYSTWIEDGGGQHLTKHPAVFRDLLIMKLPILLFDLLIAYLIYRLIPENKRKIGVALWLLNPFSIYAIYAFGHFDIIPSALTLASVLFFYKKRFVLSYILLGFAAGFKVYPLLLLPFWLILDNRPIKQRLVGLTSVVGGFLLLLLPILTSFTALKSVFLSNLTSGLFKSSFEIGGNQQLPVYLVLYFLLLLAGIFGYLKKVSLEVIIILLLGVLFGLSHFHPQWMLWLMPFLLLIIFKYPVGWKEVVLLLLSYLGIVFLIDDTFVSFSLFKAVNNAFDTLPSIRDIVDKIGLSSQLQNSLHALFLALIIWIVLEGLGKVKNSGQLKFERVNLPVFLGIWILGIGILFFLVHIPISLQGRYIDTEQLDHQSKVTLTADTVITQKIPVFVDNFNGLDLRVSNEFENNDSDLIVELFDDKNDLVQRFAVGGKLLKYNHDLKLNFPPVKDSKGKEFILKLSSPTVPKGEEIFIPFDVTEADGRLSVVKNNQPVTSVQGKLAYVTFYNPGGILENMMFSLQNIGSKF